MSVLGMELKREARRAEDVRSEDAGLVLSDLRWKAYPAYLVVSGKKNPAGKVREDVGDGAGVGGQRGCVRGKGQQITGITTREAIASGRHIE